MATGLRVLVLTNLFPRRPGEKQGNFILDQVRALATANAHVTVLVARPWSPLPYLAAEHKRRINEREFAGECFEVWNASYFSLPRFALGERAYDFARQGVLPALNLHPDWDIVHAHGFLMGHVANCFAARQGIPSVVTIHGIETHPKFDDNEAKRAKISRVLEDARQVVLVGSPLLEYCRRYTSNTDHFVVVGNGFTAYSDLKASQRIPMSQRLRVVAVSNYEESKGFDLLVEGIARPELRQKLELVIVGGGDGLAKLQNRVRELGLQNSIHLTGLLPHKEALAEVLAGDIFCLPSWREAFGIMYAEAMALGKFTMGCKGQGPSDFIQHRQTGYLMEPGSTDAVAQALAWVIENPSETAAIARRGQEFATSSLTWKANAARMLGLYQSLLDSRCSAASVAANRSTPA